MITKKSQLPCHENRNFLEMILGAKKIIVPCIQRPIVGTPSTSKWISDEILSTTNETFLNDAVTQEEKDDAIINCNTMVVYEDKQSIYIYDAQQRMMYILAFINACLQIFRNFGIKLPKVEFERSDMMSAYNCFVANAKLQEYIINAVNVRNDEQVSTQRTAVNEMISALSKGASICYNAMNSLTRAFKESIKVDVNTHNYNTDENIVYFKNAITNALKAIYFEVTICPTKDIAVEKFLNANSGGIEMNKTNFCEAITMDAAQKLGVADYNATKHTEYLAQAVLTWGIYKSKSGQSGKVNSLRDIMQKYITCNIVLFREFADFLVEINRRKDGKSYGFIDVIKRNDFKNLYLLLIANNLERNDNYLKKSLSKLGYLSLAASISGARGSYFSPLVKNLQDVINGKNGVVCDNSIVEETIDNILGNMLPAKFTEKSVRSKIKSCESVHELVLYLTNLAQTRTVCTHSSTNVEHLIPVSQKNYKEHYKPAVIHSLGNKYLLQESLNKTAKDETLAKKYAMYFPEDGDDGVEGDYIWEGNLQPQSLKRLSEMTTEQVEVAVKDRADFLIDCVCENPFFKKHFLDATK